MRLVLLLLTLVLGAAAAAELRGGAWADTAAADAVDKPKMKACWEDAEDRGRGHMPEKGECKGSDMEKSLGLCYHKCEKKNTKGLGPLCWDQCRDPLPNSALFFCCESEDECTELVTALAKKIPEALIKFGIDITINPGNIMGILKQLRELVKDALKLTLPLCDSVWDDSDEPLAIADAPFVAQS